MTKNQLIQKYIDIRDEIMDYTMEHFDNMSYDIEGYLFEDLEDIDELKQQVKAFELMLKCYKKINYLYC